MLESEGVDFRISGRIDVVVVQAVLLYGSDTLLMTPSIERMLGGFHHRVDRRLAGWKFWRDGYGRWVYPLLEEAMEKGGLQEVENYVSRRQNTVS